jgi:hypothetical protein
MAFREKHEKDNVTIDPKDQAKMPGHLKCSGENEISNYWNKDQAMMPGRLRDMKNQLVTCSLSG